MKNLIKQLQEQTESLRVQFIVMMGEYADGEFDRQSERADWNYKQWAEFLGVGYEYKGESSKGPWYEFTKVDGVSFYNHKKSVTFDNALTKATRIKNSGRSAFVNKAMANAEAHYQHSIEKLAFRIDQKNLNQEKIEMITSHMDVNIETIITDGEKTVKAWTIIASGPVQKPHYRYLIK